MVISSPLVPRLAFISILAVALIARLSFVAELTGRHIRSDAFLQFFDFQPNFFLHPSHLLPYAEPFRPTLILDCLRKHSFFMLLFAFPYSPVLAGSPSAAPEAKYFPHPGALSAYGCQRGPNHKPSNLLE